MVPFVRRMFYENLGSLRCLLIYTYVETPLVSSNVMTVSLFMLM